MISGPILRRELKQAARRRDVYWARCVTGLLLAAAATVPAVVALGWGVLDRTVYTPDGLRTFGTIVLASVVVLQVVVLAAVVPSLAGGAVAEERERGDLAFPPAHEADPGRDRARQVTGPARAGAWAGDGGGAGRPLRDIPLGPAAGYRGVGLRRPPGYGGHDGVLAVLASAWFETVANSKAVAMLLVFAWLIAPPIVSAMPGGANPPWADLLAGLKLAAAPVSPSSPLSLALDRAWARNAFPRALRTRVATMLGSQAVVGLVAFTAATLSVRRLGPRPNDADPFRGYRPLCGDDPIYWREYDLPNRTGSVAKPVIWVRASCR